MGVVGGLSHARLLRRNELREHVAGGGQRGRRGGLLHHCARHSGGVGSVGRAVGSEGARGCFLVGCGTPTVWAVVGCLLRVLRSGGSRLMWAREMERKRGLLLGVDARRVVDRRDAFVWRGLVRGRLSQDGRREGDCGGVAVN